MNYFWWRFIRPLTHRRLITERPYMWTDGFPVRWNRCDVCNTMRFGLYVYHEVYGRPGHGWWYECEACYQERMARI